VFDTAPMSTEDPIAEPLPVGQPLDLTEYESGFVDGYLASRGIFDSAPKELQRALAALKRQREGFDPSKAKTPHGFGIKATKD
jgi:hypothetical protein